MQAVNLLPLEARPAGRWVALGTGLTPARVLPLGAAAAAAVALLIAGVYIHERSLVNSKRSTLTERQTELVSLQAKAQVVKDAQAQAAALTSAVQSIVGGRMIWDTTLGDLARVLPPGVFLTSLTASAPAPAPSAPVVAAPVVPSGSTDSTSTTTTTTTTITPAAPVAPVAPTTAFSISGVAPSHDTVALVLDRLSLLPWLSGINLVSTTRQATGTAQFNISAVIVNNGGH
jgi:Tfp pilus assembly protein PilN